MDVEKKIYIIFFFILAMGLTGCMNVATTGAQAIYNQHGIKKSLNDQLINMQAFQAIHHTSKDFKDANVSVTTYNGEVLIAGEVPESWQKQQAEAIIRKIPNVKEVYNLVQVTSPSSTLTRMTDAWITAKVKAKLIASDDLDATQIKVVTENGTVYLMGVLPRDEADVAAELASTTSGVERVVKIFSYVIITKNLSEIA